MNGVPLKPFQLLDNSFLTAERQIQKRAQQGRNWKVSVSCGWAWFSHGLLFSTNRWHTRKYQFYLVHFYDGEIVHSSLFFLRACECSYTAELSEIYLCGCVCGCVCMCVRLCAEAVGTCGDWRTISIIIDSDACRQAGGVRACVCVCVCACLCPVRRHNRRVLVDFSFLCLLKSYLNDRVLNKTPFKQKGFTYKAISRWKGL